MNTQATPEVLSTPRIPIDSIWFDRSLRQRKEIETSDLEASIRRIGLIQPIVVTRDLQLQAGERRLTACKRLGWTEIPVHFLEDLPPIERKIVELEENIKRENLPWQDRVRAISEIHGLYREHEGAAWTQESTGRAISIDQSLISKYIQVAEHLDEARISECKTVNEAINFITRRLSRLQGDVLQDILDSGPTDETPTPGHVPSPYSLPEPSSSPAIIPPTPRPAPSAVSPIIQQDFLQWAPFYTGQKFNLIHCDFPYGIQAFAGPQSRGIEAQEGLYDDSKDIFFALLESLCRNLDRIMSISGHLMFWYSERHGPRIREIFSAKAPSLQFSTFPLIWLKSCNTGVSPDPSRTPRHIYETCLLASRGGRNIVQVRGDAYSSPTDKTLHASTKPEPMLRHFMSMLVDEHTTLLDPTCGSGAALRAADSLGASQLLGLEINPMHVGNALMALREARRKREALRLTREDYSMGLDAFAGTPEDYPPEEGAGPTAQTPEEVTSS